MTTDVDTIVARYDAMRSEMGDFHEMARDITELYEGRVEVVLPEIDEREEPSVPNLAVVGVDQHAMRIASTIPTLSYEPLGKTKAAEDRARMARRASMGWWELSEWHLKNRRRARWYVAYGVAPAELRFDRKLGVPRWHLPEPLSTFPGPCSDPDDMDPPWCIFDFTRSLAWLEGEYPEAALMLRRKRDAEPSQRFTLIKYIDDSEIVLIALGVRDQTTLTTSWSTNADTYSGVGKRVSPVSGGWKGSYTAVELERSPNFAGICTVVVPGRVVLDRRMGAFKGMVGTYKAQAKLWALEQIAIQRGIFPNTWAVFDENSQGEIITQADGLMGITGEIRGGKIEVTTESPSYMADRARDYLERSARIDGAIPADYTGESASNVRTGRRGESILAATTDFGVQEAQEVFERSAKHEMVRAIAVAKGYARSRRVTFAVSWRGARGRADYQLSREDIFADDGASLRISYPFPGSDINGQAIRTGQKLGTGLLSKRTARDLDPEIDDGEAEGDKVMAEALESALLQGIGTQAATGAIPPADLARIIELVRTDRMDLAGAVDKVQREAQERQAQTVEPVPVGSPAAQPGIAQPGAGAEAGVAIPEAPASQQNLAGLLSSLRRPQMTLPAERAG